MARWGLLLINLGTPASPAPSDVRRYLREFLSDPRVIDIAAWKRSLLLNLIILPFRPRASGEAYAKIWDAQRGSPLLFHGQDLAAALAQDLGEQASVKLAMRYQEPSIGDALAAYQAEGVDRIVVFPLFPHYASSSWGSAVEELYRQAGNLNNTPHLQVLEPYYEHPAFVDAYAGLIRQGLDAFAPDKLLMSFHGIPVRYFLEGGDPYYCYCQKTGRLLAEALELSEDEYLVSFQSLFGKEVWLQPYTDETLKKWAADGVESVDVICPGFSADCLETIEEIDGENRGYFEGGGGKRYRYIPALNDRDDHVACLADVVLRHLQGWEGAAAQTGERGATYPHPT